MAQLENFRLKVFRAVAERLSFRKAAEDLFLTQPAVTLQIKALENDLGVRLFDFSLVKLPVVDTDGYPVQKRGVTVYNGLYFLGMPWLHNRKSGILFGVGDDAAYVAAHIAARETDNAEAWPSLVKEATFANKHLQQDVGQQLFMNGQDDWQI